MIHSWAAAVWWCQSMQDCSNMVMFGRSLSLKLNVFTTEPLKVKLQILKKKLRRIHKVNQG